MKYGIWRHENALGNSAEHTIALAKHIERIQDEDPIIYVEKDFQKYMAMCIPKITEDRIKFFDPHIIKEFDRYGPGKLGEWVNTHLATNEEYKDVHLPYVYAYKLPAYNGMWEDLPADPDITLKFPYETYNNKFNIPSKAIIIQVREQGTYWKRIDGANCEPDRFVNPTTFKNIALYYADRDYKMIRIGDPNQTPFPSHENIIDLAMNSESTVLDDLYAISESSIFLSCDSSIWPMAGGMKKNLILSNVTSALNKKCIVDWLPKETSIVHFKELVNGRRMDNDINLLINSIETLLNRSE